MQGEVRLTFIQMGRSHGIARAIHRRIDAAIARSRDAASS
jgi:hypothetical protein